MDPGLVPELGATKLVEAVPLEMPAIGVVAVVMTGAGRKVRQLVTGVPVGTSGFGVGV